VKKISILIILISFLIPTCKNENPVVQEDDGISWEQITGIIAYVKGNVLYYLDSNTKSVKSLSGINLTNLKWNKTAGKITGIRFINDSTYALDGIDLTGNYSVINDKLNSKYYDWLPDGRLVTISKEDKLTIGGEILLDQKFNPVFGLACSPNGEKLVISTDNLFKNLLLEIDINSLEQRTLESNSNLFDPNFEQPIYSLESDKVFYVTYTFVFRLLDPSLHKYRVWSMPKRELGAGKDICRSDNLQRIFYTKVDASNARIIGIHSIDIYNGDTVELIKGGHTPVWIY
jgi:hypothetical protein